MTSAAEPGRHDTNDRCDVAVIGTGLAGLTAALRLQRAGYRVRVVERLGVAGGLCGHWRLDGYEFVRACNEFGYGLVRELAALEVPVEFVPTRSRFFLGGETFHLPPTASTVARLLRRAPGFVRLVLAARRHGYAYLSELVDHHAPEGALADLAGVVAYTAGVPMQYIRLEDLRDIATGRYGYGLHKLCKPVGGPQAMVDGMVRRLRERGGVLSLATECRGIEGGLGAYVVRTSRGDLQARAVVTSQPRWDRYPADSTSGLKLAQVLLAVRKDFAFPDGIHTVYHVPSGVRRWMNDLDAGRAPSGFGYNLLRNFLPEQPDHQTLVGYFLVPRGEEQLDDGRRRELLDYVLAHAEPMLPGLGRALIYQRIVSPADFQKLHGLSSAPLPVLPKAGFRRPDSLDAATGIYHVGNSVHPPGDHAGAAVLCGARAAEGVARQLARGAARAVPSAA